jgi:hypothetical protein
MPTITCSITGSTIPNANQSRSLLISDADLQRTLDWLKVAGLQIAADKFNNGVTAGYTPAVPHLEWAWFQIAIVNGTTQAEQNHSTIPAQPPAPITIT